MLLTIVLYIVLALALFWTIIPTLREHSGKERSEAFVKCIVIWAISSFPVIVSLFFLERAKLSWGFVFFELSGSPFSWAEQLVYSSTFLAPVIFAVVDGFRVLSSDKPSSKKRRFEKVFRRYWRVFIPAIALLLISTSVFTAIKINEEVFKSTVFFSLIGNKSILIYLISWIYWYCVVLIDSGEGEDPAASSGQRTQDFTDAARDRLGEA